MFLKNWLRGLLSRPEFSAAQQGRQPRRRSGRSLCRPRLEGLEDRLAPATLTVTTLSDATGHSGTSLRDAIAAANSGDTIQFQTGLNGAIDLSTAENGQGVLTLSKNVTIDGSGGAITVEGGNTAGRSTNARVFLVNSGVAAALNGLTIANGYTASSGGGIFNGGTLTVSYSTLAGDSAPSGSGGGIDNIGTLTVNNSTLSSNWA